MVKRSVPQMKNRSFTDFPLDAGTYDYDLIASIGKLQTAPVSCSVTILPPPINLACTFYGAPINLVGQYCQLHDDSHRA